jgi:hypothetical protein
MGPRPYDPRWIDYREWDVRARGDSVAVFVVGLVQVTDHDLFPGDERPWVEVLLSVDDAREFALAVQEAARLIKEGGYEEEYLG